MGRGLSDQQREVLRRIGDQYRDLVDVRCRSESRSNAGLASWSRALRRLEERGLIERFGYSTVRLSDEGRRVYEKMKSSSQQSFVFTGSDESDWVYTCRRGPNDSLQWFAHRVVKATEKRLHVSRKSIPASWVGTDREKREDTGKPFQFDRQQFERQGWVRHGSKRNSAFYQRPGMERVKSPDDLLEERRVAREAREREFEGWKRDNPEAWAERQRQSEETTRKMMEDYQEELRRLMGRQEYPQLDVVTLGLSWPCTKDEVKGAYRRLCKRAHPDVGGSAEDFRRIHEAYQRLLAAV
jgi:hypothetical protein